MTPEQKKAQNMRDKWRAKAIREVKLAQREGRAPNEYAEPYLELFADRNELSRTLNGYRNTRSKKESK